MVHSDLSALIIKGRPKQADLAEAWANIYYQYLDLNFENETMYLLVLNKEIALLETHITQVEGSCALLMGSYDDRLVKILADNGFKQTFPSEEPVKYYHILTSIGGRLAPKRLTLQAKKKEKNDYLKAREKDEITETYFDKWLIRLAKHQGVGILRAKDITTKEFVLLIKDYLEFVSLHNKEIDDAKERAHR